MAYFAQINKDSVVTEVIAVNNATIDYLPYPESEPVGQEFIASLGLTGLWLQTSYNNNFRGTFASIGYTYDETDDVFVPLPSVEPIDPV
jgi:hypothetical protein